METTFDGKHVTKTVKVFTLANGQLADYRTGMTVENIDFDYDRERISLDLVTDGQVHARVEFPFDGNLTLVLGPVRRAEVEVNPRFDKLVDTHRRTEAALPSNYTARIDSDLRIIVEGYDSCGWTLEDYVIPRLATCTIFATEVH